VAELGDRRSTLRSVIISIESGEASGIERSEYRLLGRRRMRTELCLGKLERTERRWEDCRSVGIVS
jgi:hypothetical protein